MSSFVARLACSRCGRAHPAGTLQTLCTDCGSPLVVDYDLEAVGAAVKPGDLAGREPTMWRYRELLPVADAANIVTLGEGMTPMGRAPRLEEELGLAEVWLKDEGLNPTGTFKARGASCGVSMARELGVRELGIPTAGNAGGAWAAYGAAAGIPVHVAMPSDAPTINRLEALAYGADVIQVDGLIDDAARAIAERSESQGWFDVAGLREPYRIEGKKTMGLEIAEQLGWRAPDAILYPTGGGVGVIGIWRAMWQLRALGWLQGELPRMIVVQAEGCAPVVRAFEQGLADPEPWPDAHTIASGLRVPSARGHHLSLRAIRDTGGTAVAVNDEEIVAAVGELARATGVLAAPEGAATLAAARRLRERGDLEASDRVVLLNTGSGLKYPEVLR